MLSQPYNATNRTDLLSAARKIGNILGSLNGLMKLKLPPSNAVLEPPKPPVVEEKPLTFSQNTVPTPQAIQTYVAPAPAPIQSAVINESESKTVQSNVTATPAQASIIEPEEEEEEDNQPVVEPLPEEEASQFPIKVKITRNYNNYKIRYIYYIFTVIINNLNNKISFGFFFFFFYFFKAPWFWF